MVFFDFSSVSEAVICKQHRFFQRYHMSTNTVCMLFGDKAGISIQAYLCNIVLFSVLL